MTEDALAEAVEGRLRGRGPHLVGIGGPVAVGKSTIAATLAGRLQARGRRTNVVSTDSFLLPNDVLGARNLSFRKGFPETYDAHALAAALREAKAGEWPIPVPVYSHETYDIVPGESALIDDCDVLLVDGVVALQEPAVGLLDAGVYVDADPGVVRGWFVKRFQDLVEAARAGEASFYRAFVHMDPADVRAVAEATWEGINEVNLREHIEPSRARASVIVLKGEDHRLLQVSRA